MSGDAETFASWCERWTKLGSYTDVPLPDVDSRQQQLIALWRSTIPGSWQRGTDARVLSKKYCRRDVSSPTPGEHRLEYEVLVNCFSDVVVFDATLVDGVNAMPLVRDEGGGRTNNVEADLYLLIRNSTEYRLVVAEVKVTAQYAWYATVENLRQLRLFAESDAAQQLFHKRNPGLKLSAKLPVTGIVLAPASYYSKAQQKAQSTAYARQLVEAMRTEVGCDVRLAVWTAESRRIDELDATRTDA